jgi:hypothetical protein
VTVAEIAAPVSNNKLNANGNGQRFMGFPFSADYCACMQRLDDIQVVWMLRRL